MARCTLARFAAASTAAMSGTPIRAMLSATVSSSSVKPCGM